MIRDLVGWLDFSNLAEAALLMFVATFGMIVYGVFRLSRETTERYASIPLSDDEVKDPRHGQ